MFVSDQPIDSIDQDLLGRKTFEQRLAAAIKNINSRDCYAIALQGKWGCGKTSLINMVLAEIGKASPEPDSPCLRIIQFCPWNFTDTAQLISQFFVRLSSALKTYVCVIRLYHTKHTFVNNFMKILFFLNLDK